MVNAFFLSLAEMWYETRPQGDLKMRKLLLVAVVLVAGAESAMAYDKFIPMGQGYSTNNFDGANLTAEQQAAINQADIYETELYLKLLRQKQLDSQMNRMMFDRQNNDFGTTLGY
jgi:hypothetical protein